MKYLIIGDLHGEKPLVHFKDFDAVICTGDFCSSEARKYMFQAITNPDINWYDICGKTKAKRLVKKSLANGRKILKSLNSLSVPVYLVPGNLDWTKTQHEPVVPKNPFKKLIKGLKNIINVDFKLRSTGEHNIIGYGVNSGPEKEKEKKQTNKKLKTLFKKAKNPIIFLSHNPPYKTAIDKIVNPESPRHGEHYGSISVRETILKHKPLVNIAGHMHEHFKKIRLGKTTCINAGLGNKGNVLLNLENNKIKQINFHKK